MRIFSQEKIHKVRRSAGREKLKHSSIEFPSRIHLLHEVSAARNLLMFEFHFYTFKEFFSDYLQLNNLPQLFAFGSTLLLESVFVLAFGAILSNIFVTILIRCLRDRS